MTRILFGFFATKRLLLTCFIFRALGCGLLPLKRDKATGRFISVGPYPWEVFMEKHKVVKEWLENRPFGTKDQYCRKLMHFCETMNVTPEEFLAMDRFKARDLVWSYVKPFINESVTKAKNCLAALKSFYRSKDGEILPFDSARGGKHYFNVKRRKKAAYEHIPTKAEMYRIIDAANNIRDKAILLVLFQSGIRVGALCNLKFKHVKDQLYREDGPKIPLRLRITDDIDTKLRGYAISFYDTFLQGEAVNALKAYCDKYHKDKDENAPLFYSRLGRPLTRNRIWEIVKRCVKRAGLDPKRIWVHTIRRAFRDVLRHTEGLTEEFREAIMGHVLPGSEENYFSRHKIEDLEAQYMKADFGREIPETKVQKQAKEIRELRQQVKVLDEQLKMLAGMLTLIYNGRAKPAVVEGKPEIQAWRVKWDDAVKFLGVSPEVIEEVKKQMEKRNRKPSHL